MIFLFFYLQYRSLPKNSPNCLIFNKQKFENFNLALELFAKPLPIFKTCM